MKVGDRVVGLGHWSGFTGVIIEKKIGPSQVNRMSVNADTFWVIWDQNEKSAGISSNIRQYNVLKPADIVHEIYGSTLRLATKLELVLK